MTHGNASIFWGPSSSPNIRVYYQDSQNNIKERLYGSNGWQNGNGGRALSSAQAGTSISAITWDSNGQREIRVYFNDASGKLVEWQYGSNGWSQGGFSA